MRLKMEMPEKIYAIKTHKYGGIFNIDKLKTLSCQPDGAYYHENILKAKDAEIEELKEALGQISRMSPLPDHESNTMTLVACREIAKRIIENGNA